MFESTNLTATPFATGTPFPLGAKSHHEVSAWRTETFLSGVRDGQYNPMTLNLFLECNTLAILYFLIPNEGNTLFILYFLVPKLMKGIVARYGAFGACAALQVYIINSCRSGNPTVGFLIGFLSGWNILWSATLLVFNDAKRHFKKIQKGKSEGDWQWQPFPKTFGERFGWALDLVMNSRGIGWSWKVSGTPSRPPKVEAALRKIDIAEAIKEDKPISTGRRRFNSRSQAISYFAMTVVSSYVLMDVIKILVNHDPYFWGLIDAPPPAYYPSFITDSRVVTNVYRLAVSLGFMFLSLRSSFALVPIAFLLFASGTNSEPWMYPDQYGPYSSVPSRGTAGFWGGWWHQLFRYSLQDAGRWVTKSIGLKPKSQGGAVLELLLSFYLSGFMHMAASVTMIGDTSPWKSMFFFFALQPAGIIFELIASHFLYLALRKTVPKQTLKYAGMAARTLYCHAWLYLTLPYLVDDLAKGGAFLAEPSPISPLRALGLGVPGDTAFPWQDAVFHWRWHSDKWWLSGMAF